MNDSLKPGIQITIEKLVKQEDTAKKYGSGLVEVFATPAMIALMEKASLELVGPYLPEGHNTVGIEVNIKHLKATPVGEIVRCTAHLKEIEGRRLVFEVNAWDNEGLIGSGMHSRVIIDTQKFMSKLSKKQE